jgi:hypothetical protein
MLLGMLCYPHMITSIRTPEVRARIGELLEKTYYQEKQFRILRKDKPMARLVSEHFMTTLERLLSADPMLEETLSLMLDTEAMAAIEQSQAEFARGEKIELSKALG